MADAPDGRMVHVQDHLGASLGPGLPVLSLKRPRHEVDHVHFALCNDTVLIVAKKSSKKFICHTLVSEFSQRYKEKWTVVLTDNSSDLFTKELIKRLMQFLPNNPLTCFDNQPEPKSLISGNNKQNVLVTTPNYLLHCFANHYLHPKDISVLILNFCVSVDIALDRDCPYKQLLEVLRHEIVKPRVVGVMHLEHAYISNVLELSKQLNHITSIYGLPVHLSRDLLAMNTYREEIEVENIVYNTTLSRPLEANICSLLKDILRFLFDVNIQGCSKSFCKLKAIVAWSIHVLIILGLWSFQYSLESIQKAFHNLEAEVNDPMEILAIQLCDSQFKVFQKLINTTFKTELNVMHSQLVYNICDFLTPYKVYCTTASSSEQNEQENITTDDQKTEVHPPHETTNECTTGNPLSNEMTTNLETRLVKLKSKDHFRCTIVVRSNSFAKLLSKLINYLSSSCEKYSFLKSKCITQSNKRSRDTDDNMETILHAVQQGLINVVVTTSELSTELLVTSCNVLMCFDVPDTYQKYFTMKQKVRGLAPKFVIVTPEEQLAECKTKLQVFKDIEEQMEMHVSDYISLKKKDKWLKYLEQDSLQCYAPFGKDGPKISMISTIHIINRYCHKISRGDFSNLHTQFITQKRDVSENITMIKSDLFLPFGSSCQDVIQGHPIHVENENDVEVGILKSKMDASLQCVRLLHESSKLDDDLELVEELFFDPNNEEVKIFELEDEGKGRAGTNKRRRAYEMKVPSFFKDNMPLAHEPLFLYKIEFRHSKTYHPGVSHQRHPEIQLGILSKKPSPRIPNFVIYTAECEMTVSITTSKPSADPLRLDNDQLARVREFHQYVFQDLFKFTSHWMLSEKDGYLIVPLVPGLHAQIHFDFLKEFQDIASDTNSRENSQPASKDFTMFENKIVRRLNESASQLRCTKYYVIEVCSHLNPASPFPDPDVAATFADYYHDRYGIKLNPDQPLLLVGYLPSRINYLCPRHWKEEENSDVTVTKEKSKSAIYLIPELCVVLPLSASAWRIIRYLPTIVYRLGTLLLADELKCRIQEETGIGSDPWPDHVPQPQLGAGDNVGEERLDWLSLNEGADTTEYVLDESTTTNHCQDSDNQVPQNDMSATCDHCKGHGNHVHELDHSTGEEKLDRVSPNDGTGKAPYVMDESATLVNGNHTPELAADNSTGEGCPNNNMVLDPSPAHNHANHITSALRSDCPGSVTNLHALPSPTTGPNIGPCITLMLRALTARSAGQYFHSERLEILGDSLLKQEVSMELYLTHCDKDEWALSIFRAHLVSNDMLSKQGRRLGLPGYMCASLPDIVNNSLPPGFILEGQTTKPADPNGSEASECPLNTYRHQVLGDKLVANCVEALIAAYLVSCGRSSARRFMVWLGVATHTLEELETLVNNVNQNSELSQTTSCSSEITHHNSDSPCTEDLPFYYHQPGCSQLSELRHVEETIGYYFRNKHLLLQALTHTSYSRSLALVSESYQKMEFLGDAVLDYIVTLYLFTTFPYLNHGDLTDFRSGLVNNFTVAFLAVQNRLHQFLRCMSPALIDMVGQFVDFLEEQEAKQGASWKTSIDAFVVGNPDVDESSIEVPKVLGDLFEALVCAVFLDCGMDLDVVWRVFYPMLQPFIDYYKDNIPRSPIRTLQETFPDQITFSLARLTLSKKYVCNVSVVGYGSFEATGRTSKIAKSSVARKALQHIHNASIHN